MVIFNRYLYVYQRQNLMNPVELVFHINSQGM